MVPRELSGSAGASIMRLSARERGDSTSFAMCVYIVKLSLFGAFESLMCLDKS